MSRTKDILTWIVIGLAIVLVLEYLFGFTRYITPPVVEPLSFHTELDQSVAFLFSAPDSPYIRKMREAFPVDQLAAGGTSDLERVQAATAWVHGLWSHDGSNQPEARDPIGIVNEARQSDTGFRCVEYARVLAGVLNAMGIPARALGLYTRDVETRRSGAGHVVVEAWLPDDKRWAMSDPQWNAVPRVDGKPVHAAGLQAALAEGSDVSTPALSDLRTRFWLNWISPYLVYFYASLDARQMAEPEYGERLMLLSRDLPAPTVVQRQWPIRNMSHTHSLAVFYAPPQIE